jgi:hypothetical protein
MLTFAGLTTVGAPANTGPQALAVDVRDVGAGEEALRVTRGGELVFEIVGDSFEHAQIAEAGRRRPLSFLSDVTGDGRLDLVVSESTGGGHLSHVLHVVDLGATPREIASVAAGAPEIEFFEDVDSDGQPEFLTHDWSFSGWQSCVADSPVLPVTLRFGADGPRVAWELMRKTTDPLILEGRSKAEILDTVLNGLYTDREKQAWSLLSDAWPSARRQILARLARSPYGSQLSPH